MDQQKQPNWLKVAVVTTMIGGIVQVIVNHFDNLLALLGGAIAHIHLPGSLSVVVNVLSAMATIGGAFATVLANRYRRKAEQEAEEFRLALIRTDQMLTEELERQKPQTSRPI